MLIRGGDALVLALGTKSNSKMAPTHGLAVLLSVAWLCHWWELSQLRDGIEVVHAR